MRKLLFATAILLLAATPALAASACPTFPEGTAAQNLKDQTAVMLCEQQALAAATAQKQQNLDIQSDLQQQQLDFDEQLKLQQTFSAAQSAAIPSSSLPPY